MFERVVYDQVEAYLDQKKAFVQIQSGFRGRFSTDKCLIHLTDYFKLQMNEGNYVGMVLLDLQQAFDTVDHNIFLMKLEGIGLNQDVVRWFRSYLADRHQLVDVSGTLLSCAEIKGLFYDSFYFRYICE